MGDLLISSGTFYPDIGGPPTYLKQLCDVLNQQGTGLQVLSFGDPSSEQKKKLLYPVTYITRFLPLIVRLPWYTLALLRKVIFAKHWYVNDYGFPAYWVSLLTGKKYHLKIVGDFAWEWSTRHAGYQGSIDDFQLHRPGFRSRLLQSLQKAYVSRAKTIIVPSQYLKKIVMAWGIPGTKIQVIYNAVQIQNADTHQTIQLEKIASSEIVFCTVARLVAWKGIDSMLEALGALKHLEFRYLIVGSGPDRDRLEKMALDLGLQGKVFFLGNKTAAEVSAVLNRSKLFVLLSRYEGLPHVILEALTHRIPCLTSNRGGFPEVISKDTGVMLDVGSADFKSMLKQTLQSFIQGQHALNALKPVVPENFRFETMLKQTQAVILS